MPVDHACPRWRTLSRPRARRPVSRLASRKKRKARTHARLHNGGTRTCARDNTDELRRICTHGSSTAHDTRLVAYTWPYTRGRTHVAVAVRLPPCRTRWMHANDLSFLVAAQSGCQRAPKTTGRAPRTRVCAAPWPHHNGLSSSSPRYSCTYARLPSRSLYIWCEPCALRPTLRCTAHSWAPAHAPWAPSSVYCRSLPS